MCLIQKKNRQLFLISQPVPELIHSGSSPNSIFPYTNKFQDYLGQFVKRPYIIEEETQKAKSTSKKRNDEHRTRKADQIGKDSLKDRPLTRKPKEIAI